MHIRTLILIFILGFSFESPAENICADLFNSEYSLTQISLQNKLDTKLKSVIRESDLEDGVQHYSIRIVDDYEVYGIALFSYDPISKTIEIIQMESYEGYQEKGLAKFVMEEITKSYPDTQFIRVRALGELNLDIKDHYSKMGYSQIDAIKMTPAYKIRAHVGFSEIIPESLTPLDGFIVKKP